MTLYNLKPFVYILFHILVIDQVLLELFRKLRRQSFDAINLFRNLLPNF